MTKIADNYDKKYMKIKFNSDDILLLSIPIEIRSMIIVVRAILMKTTNIIHKLS